MSDAPEGLPPVDLHDALERRSEAFVEALPALDRMAVGLWEGGVRVDLDVAGQAVSLKLRPREDGGAAYATTASAEVALEVPDGAPLARRTERVVLALLKWVEGMDKGRLVLRREEPEAPEEAEDPDAPEPLRADDAPQARAALHLAEVELACLADQRAALAGWQLDDELLVLLSAREDHAPEAMRAARLALVSDAAAAGLRRAAVGGRQVWGHPDLEAVLGALVESGFDEIEVEAPADPDAIGTLALWGATTVVLPADAEETAAAVVAAGHLGVAVHAWLPATAEVVAGLGPRVEALTRAGAEVLLVPAAVAGLPADANPVELSEVAEGCEVTAAGMPVCMVARRPHSTSPLPAWRLAEDGTVFGVVCRFCTAQARCPGVPREHLERWRTRGMVPVLDL
ncbi:MAG: hypothetical protein H6732_05480 [Alphaproteobacteria bacterium]|nr:hypothetical protein [Alphaproteobacteria bacterium]